MPLHPGDWLWLCRAGYEEDLVDELTVVSKSAAAERVADGLVRSKARPKRGGGQWAELAFARQAMPVDAVVVGRTAAELGARAAEAIAPKVGKKPFALHAITADSDEGNRLAARAEDVERTTIAALAERDAELPSRRVEAHLHPEGRDPLVQICLLAADRAAVGTMPIGAAPSLAPGGRLRIGAPREAPSRAAAKLLEAFEWLGRRPDKGDLCIDLGAAPGGWTHVLVGLRAHVLAVDPARLAPTLARNKQVTHVRKSAFEYLPEEAADWLFCDMAWRPLEVAALLAKWGRRGAARFLVANFKLPMKKKVEYIRRVKDILATGGWRELRVRQLYHDRDEVTVAGWRLG